MKIEPRKTAKLPKYAAALAALASAAVLTGCRTAGEVATDGTAPDPNAGANIIEQTLGSATLLIKEPIEVFVATIERLYAVLFLQLDDNHRGG